MNEAMKKASKPWYKQKTTKAALAAILGAAAGVISGELALVAAIQIAIPAVLAIFIRDAVN